MGGVTRREFVRAAAATTAAAPWVAPGSVLGGGMAGAPRAQRSARASANAKIGVAFIGTGKRAFELLGPCLDHPELRVTAVCDVDATRRDYAKKLVDQKYGMSEGGGCPALVEYREVLGRGDVDAVLIMTPDHWHANQVIDAARAKKDIYCEKPMSLTLAEGKAMIDAVRHHGRVFQTGSQQRTEYDGKFRAACEYVRSGRIGDLLTVHVGVGESSVPCDLPEEAMEPGLDWDRWLGPAPMRPYNSVLAPRGVHKHYPSWRLYKEYSGGMMTDFGAHHFDIAQWGLDRDASGPVLATPPDDPKAMYGARLKYANGVEMVHGGPSGVTFIGRQGIVHVDRGRLAGVPEEVIKAPLKESEVHLPRAANQLQNWIDCIRSRQRCICDVEVGARSVAVCHLANQAYWHRRPLKWDPAKWEFQGDDEANTWRDYERRKGYELPAV